MIIDSRKYSGMCTCGRNHIMDTQVAVVEAGCMEKVDHYLSEYGLTGFRTVIYDDNTYNAQGLIRPRADQEIILKSDNLHANEKGVEAAKTRISDKTQVLVAVGSGTIHDIVRYCAYELNLPFVACPTAASVDGFCSSVVAMTWEGCKKTLTAVAPRLVLADLNIITKAPIRLARSGFGDMIGKYIALTDWKIAHILNGEFYCERIAEIMQNATREVLESAEGIAKGQNEAYEKLTYGLLLSGLAMQMMGNSRPASGAEHHISHIIEMAPENLYASSEALHGEKVGVGTILAAEEYHRLAALPADCWQDYPGFSEEQIYDMFGERLSRQIVQENEKDSADQVTGERIRECLEAIRQEIAAIPSADTLRKVYRGIGAKQAPEEIDVTQTTVGALFTYSPMVRNRLTFMRLRHCVKPQIAPMDGSEVLLAAHRGDKKNCPENTMPAFKASLRMGVDMIETDVHMTSDGELILIHDRNALRTTGFDKLVTDMTLDEVKKLDAGCCFSEAFRDVRIPTVREFLEWIGPTNLLVNWELKDYPDEVGEDTAFTCADKLMELIREYGMEKRSMVNSFSDRVLEHICQKCGHEFPVHGQGIYRCKRTKDTAQTEEKELFDWCCLYPEEKGKNPVDYRENFDYCVENGILPCVCIPDKEETYEKAISFGCKMFTTNDIGACDAVLRKLGVR